MSLSRRCSITSMIVPLALLTGGCASTLTAVLDRPITSDHLDEFRNRERVDENKLKTMSGDRRLLRVQFTHETDASKAFLADETYNSKWVICAETQADAIAARGGQSALTVNGQGSGTDQFTQTLLLTNARSAVSDVVRQLGWQVCNAFMNGALTKAEYSGHLDKLREGAFLALKAPGGPPGTQNPSGAKLESRTETTFEPSPPALPEAPPKPCKTGETCPSRGDKKT